MLVEDTIEDIATIVHKDSLPSSTSKLGHSAVPGWVFNIELLRQVKLSHSYVCFSEIRDSHNSLEMRKFSVCSLSAELC